MARGRPLGAAPGPCGRAPAIPWGRARGAGAPVKDAGGDAPEGESAEHETALPAAARAPAATPPAGPAAARGSGSPAPPRPRACVPGPRSRPPARGRRRVTRWPRTGPGLSVLLDGSRAGSLGTFQEPVGKFETQIQREKAKALS